VTDPAHQQPDQIDSPEDMSAAPTSPADVASAARSCSAIILVLIGIVLLLCVAFVISQIA
jgi:hypothetical protein